MQNSTIEKKTGRGIPLKRNDHDVNAASANAIQKCPERLSQHPINRIGHGRCQQGPVKCDSDQAGHDMRRESRTSYPQLYATQGRWQQSGKNSGMGNGRLREDPVPDLQMPPDIQVDEYNT